MPRPLRSAHLRASRKPPAAGLPSTPAPPPCTTAFTLTLLSALLVCALAYRHSLGLRGGHHPLDGSASLLYLAPPGPCTRTDFASAPVASPEHWVPSGVYDGTELLDFALALPDASASFMTEWMTNLGGIWAPIETMIFLCILSSPKVRHASRLVVDVGANLGYFSQLSLKLGYEVVAFEPQARAQPYLAATAARNGNGQGFHLHACAVGSLQGPVTMSQSPKWEVSVNEGLAAAGATATVPMVTLADMLRPGVSIALLKVDTEGFERGVLAGLTPQLLASVRNIVVEVKTSETRAWVIKELEQAGFFCRQYQEMYREKHEFALPREELASKMATHLLPCSPSDPEDFWFTREEFPWQCRAVGC